ncbi:MAG: hypothetical protein CM15mP120_22960 [Pseudomonadota bacterium]|nr:MAG: hypothetical protein CM15mP120_22960 [Pseudomonadota bacterium]
MAVVVCRGGNDADETFNVTLELVKRGYTGAEIDKLWSGNLLRVMGQVQACGPNATTVHREVAQSNQ